MAELNFYAPPTQSDAGLEGAYGANSGMLHGAPPPWQPNAPSQGWLPGGQPGTASSASWDGSEPPLLEELGINFDHIWKKCRWDLTLQSLAVLNPRKTLARDVLDDDDLAGPLLFCLLFGMCLLLSGKVHFGYIYGVALIGCFGLYFILNMMSEEGINGARTTSVLGYCLLPMTLLAVLAAVVNLQGPFGLLVTFITVSWCTYAASTMFVNVLNMHNQRLLVAYPVGLLYACFALLSVF